MAKKRIKKPTLYKVRATYLHESKRKTIVTTGKTLLSAQRKANKRLPKGAIFLSIMELKS